MFQPISSNLLIPSRLFEVKIKTNNIPVPFWKLLFSYLRCQICVIIDNNLLYPFCGIEIEITTYLYNDTRFHFDSVPKCGMYICYMVKFSKYHHLMKRGALTTKHFI